MFRGEWEEWRGLSVSGRDLRRYLPLARTLRRSGLLRVFFAFAERKTSSRPHLHREPPAAAGTGLARRFRGGGTGAESRSQGGAYAPACVGCWSCRRWVGRWRGLMGGWSWSDKATKEPYPLPSAAPRSSWRQGSAGDAPPLGDVVVLLPPLAIFAGELDLLFGAVEEAIRRTNL